MKDHPSKDARWFAKSVYEYLMAEQEDSDLQDKDPELVEQPAIKFTDKMSIDVPDQPLFQKQPAQQQEPVAVARVDDLERGGRVRALAMNLSLDAPLYTAPQSKPWMGLTDDEINSLDEYLHDQPFWKVVAFARTIEAKLRKKNA